MTYKIVSDSSCNIFSLGQVPFENVPMKIRTDHKEYVDNQELDTAAMMQDLLKYKGKSGTACPSVGEWLDAFGDNDVVFGVTITSNLSGSYNSAMDAKHLFEEAHPDKKIHIVDSLSTGPEQDLIIEKLQELILAGKSFEDMVAEINEYKKSTHLLFSLESLKNLANNGRVSPIVAAMAGILGIRLVGKASDAGTLEPMHKCRGEKKALETMLSAMMNDMGYQGGKVIIGHSLNLNAAETLRDMIRNQYPNADIVIRNHAGLDCFYSEKGGVLLGFEGSKKFD